MPKKLTTKISQEYYEKLTDIQKEFFDSYVKHRTLNGVMHELNWKTRKVHDVYNAVGVQNALKEYNKNLEEYALYNTAVIVQELWEQYKDTSTPKNVKIQILSLLGKHIGMWNNAVQDKQGKQNTTNYTIINYADVQKEIKKNEKEIHEISQDFDVPEGIQLTDYSGNA